MTHALKQDLVLSLPRFEMLQLNSPTVSELLLPLHIVSSISISIFKGREVAKPAFAPEKEDHTKSNAQHET